MTALPQTPLFGALTCPRCGVSAAMRPSLGGALRCPRCEFLWNLTASTPSTTLADASAIGATSVTLTSGSGFAAGDPVLVGTGAALEAAYTKSVSGATLDPQVPLLNAHASGNAVAVAALANAA